MVEEAKSLGGDLQALEGRDVEVRNEQEQVRLVERLQDHIVECRWCVDHNHVEALLEDAQHATDQLTFDPVLGIRLDRRNQDAEARRVLSQQALERLRVERVLHAHRIRDRVHGEELHHDRHVAEREVEVDDAHRAFSVVGQRSGQVGGDRGLADATFGGEHRDQGSLGDSAGRFVGAGRGECVVQRVRPDDRLVERGEIPLLDDLAHPCSQGLSQDCGVDPAADQDDAQRRLGDTEVSASATAAVRSIEGPTMTAYSCGCSSR